MYSSIFNTFLNNLKYDDMKNLKIICDKYLNYGYSRMLYFMIKSSNPQKLSDDKFIFEHDVDESCLAKHQYGAIISKNGRVHSCDSCKQKCILYSFWTPTGHCLTSNCDICISEIIKIANNKIKEIYYSLYLTYVHFKQSSLFDNLDIDTFKYIFKLYVIL